MTPDPFDQSLFPPLPDYAVTTAPLLLEPIMGSGESLCLAVAALGADGAFQIAPILDEAKAQCLVGEQAPSLLGFMRLGMDSLSNHLTTHHAMETWRPPVAGMQLGHIASGRVDSLKDALRITARSHAFLAGLADFASDSQTQAQSEADRWPGQVRAAVTARRPALAGWFNRRRALAPGGGQTRFDYLGERLAAQLGRLIPGPGIGAQVRAAKAKLWDLEALRDAGGQSGSREHPSTYELLLYRPRDDDPAHSEQAIVRLHEALQELEYAGDQQALRVRALYDAESAAARIIEAEAA